MNECVYLLVYILRFLVYEDSFPIKQNYLLRVGLYQLRFIQQIQKSMPWPYDGQKTGIIQCYKQLQNFIIKPQNWTKSKCTSAELNDAQEKINSIYVLMQVEKQYIMQFWKVSKRRIQASICHFFIFFENVIRCIIPNQNSTIKICIQQQTLCTNLNYLQLLSNRILEQLPKIYRFMIKREFSKQRAFTDEFFSYFSGFIENLCHIKKKAMGYKIQKLIKYICLSNPLEISQKYIISQKFYESPQKPQKPRKPQKIVQQIRKSINSCQKLGSQRSINRSKDFNKSVNLLLLQNKTADQIFKGPNQLKIFQFSQMVRRHSFIIHSKKSVYSTTQHQSYGLSKKQKQSSQPKKSLKPQRQMSPRSPKKKRQRNQVRQTKKSVSQRQKKKKIQAQIESIIIKDQQIQRGQMRQNQKLQQRLFIDKKTSWAFNIANGNTKIQKSAKQKKIQLQLKKLIQDF